LTQYWPPCEVQCPSVSEESANGGVVCSLVMSGCFSCLQLYYVITVGYPFGIRSDPQANVTCG